MPTRPVPTLRFPHLGAVPGLRHALTTREGGASRGPYRSLNVGLGSGDDPEHVRENRRRVARALGLPVPVFANQVHGAEVREVVRAGDDPGSCDVLLLGARGVLAGVLAADCPLVLLVDPVNRGLALVHSGWRGTAKGAVHAAVDALRWRFGSRPGALLAGVGPSIGAARYEVGPEVTDALAAALPPDANAVSIDASGRRTVDLRRAVLAQLAEAGVPAAAREVLGTSTWDEPDLWFSHRRDGPRTGRHALVAGWA